MSLKPNYQFKLVQICDMHCTTILGVLFTGLETECFRVLLLIHTWKKFTETKICIMPCIYPCIYWYSLNNMSINGRRNTATLLCKKIKLPYWTRSVEPSKQRMTKCLCLLRQKRFRKLRARFERPENFRRPDWRRNGRRYRRRHDEWPTLPSFGRTSNSCIFRRRTRVGKVLRTIVWQYS